MTPIIPAGQLPNTNPDGNTERCPIPMAVVTQALENMGYEIVELAPDRIGARCQGYMPNFHVLTTPNGLDFRSWWNIDPLADRAAVLDALNEANLQARTWRYSVDTDGDLLVDRGVVVLGNGEVTVGDLQRTIYEGNLEMILSIKHFIGDFMA